MSTTATHKVRINTGDVAMDAELNDTETAQAIWNALPFGGQGNTWGDEIYFGIPVVKQLERDHIIQRRQEYRQRRIALRQVARLRQLGQFELDTILRVFPKKNALHVMTAALREMR